MSNLSYSLMVLGLLMLLSGCKLQAESQPKVQTGAEILIEQQLDMLQGKRVGLVTNHSAVVGDNHLIDLLHENGVKITALFGPEHGIRGDADAGDKIEDDIDQQTGAPIYSLYGDHYKPSPDMLENVDVLIFDIQDIGARFYTYTSTLGYTMQAAAENGVSYMVLDRPNPLGGENVEGFVLESGQESFVGLYPIPIVHGLTVGELAKMIKGEAWLQNLERLNLQVVEMNNWQRSMLWPDTGLPWIPPSPNIPTFEIALIYPGACFFEQTTASEGRGTMQPFKQMGAPWADAEVITSELQNQAMPGLNFESVTFTPESIKGMDSNPNWEGEKVSGVMYEVTEPDAVRPVAAGIHVLSAFYRDAMEHEKKDFLAQSVNLLAGTNRLYDMLEKGNSATEIIDSWADEVQQFEQDRQSYLLYD